MGMLTAFRKESCTLAIVNLKFFNQKDLPGSEDRNWDELPSTDLASYEDIWHATQRVEWYCVKVGRQSGWEAAGE